MENKPTSQPAPKIVQITEPMSREAFISLLESRCKDRYPDVRETHWFSDDTYYAPQAQRLCTKLVRALAHMNIESPETKIPVGSVGNKITNVENLMQVIVNRDVELRDRMADSEDKINRLHSKNTSLSIELACHKCGHHCHCHHFH